MKLILASSRPSIRPSFNGSSLSPSRLTPKHARSKRRECVVAKGQNGIKPYDAHEGAAGYVKDKQHLVQQLLLAKYDSGKSFSEIGKELGVTNLYAAQLFHNQAQLTEHMQQRLQDAVPGISDHLYEYMRQPPLRSFDPSTTQDPLIYRLTEAVLHYAESIKEVTNEELGDGIMSAIDIYSDVKIIEGVQGEKRVCITFNGKFLPYSEQLTENNTAPQ